MALIGRPNLAVTRSHFATGRVPSPAAARELLKPGRSQATVVAWDRLRVHAVASARMRGGPRAWEVDRLHLGDPVKAEELLEALTQAAWARGAQRVYLRVPYGSSIVDLARRSGFFPCFSETLLEGDGGRSPAGLPLRPRQPYEEFALFQLYSAATPTAARSMAGMSLDQWRDAREQPATGTVEEVYGEPGILRAWLAFALAPRPILVEMMVRAGDEDLVAGVVDRALARPGRQRWLVPEHQDPLYRALVDRGFWDVGRYRVLVKTMVVRALDPALAATEATAW